MSKYTQELDQLRVWSGPTVPTSGPDTYLEGLLGSQGLAMTHCGSMDTDSRGPRKILLLQFFLFCFALLCSVVSVVFIILLLFLKYFLFFYFNFTLWLFFVFILAFALFIIIFMSLSYVLFDFFFFWFAFCFCSLFHFCVFISLVLIDYFHFLNSLF